jgi:hypothetical protein
VTGKYNLTCRQGNTFNLQFTISNNSVAWNLTGYSIVMTVRPFVGASTTIITASTANGLITTDPLNGRTIVNIPATTTSGFDIGRHDYDIVFTYGSTVTTILEGKFIVIAGVTV